MIKQRDITLLGHDNTDVDSIISCILLQKLLKSQNINAKIKILDSEINSETIKLCKKIGLDISIYQSRVDDNEKVILLDHHITSHNVKVIGCIDHHFSCNNLNYSFNIIRHSCSTALIIFKLMMKSGYPIDSDIVKLVLFATFIDTCSLKSSKTNKNELSLIDELMKKYQLDYNFFYNTGLCINEITYDIESLIMNGVKSYTFNKKNFKSSYLQVHSLNDVFCLKDIIEDLKLKVDQYGLYMWIFIIISFDENVTYEYQIKTDVVHCIAHTGIVSRGETIIPNIEKNIK